MKLSEIRPKQSIINSANQIKLPIIIKFTQNILNEKDHQFFT